jgi:hypothetical protein
MHILSREWDFGECGSLFVINSGSVIVLLV